MDRKSQELARFLTTRRHYSSAQQRVKHSAFLPNRDGATSVFRVGGLSDEDVRAIANQHIIPGPGRKVHGCGFIEQERVVRTGLALDMDDTPPRHANIVGWPTDKGKQKLQAMELAEAALLRVWE